MDTIGFKKFLSNNEKLNGKSLAGTTSHCSVIASTVGKDMDAIIATPQEMRNALDIVFNQLEEPNSHKFENALRRYYRFKNGLWFEGIEVNGYNKSRLEEFWSQDYEVILTTLEIISNECLQGSKYYAIRNPRSIGEKDVDIFIEGETHRCGAIWPHKKTQCFTLMLDENIIDTLPDDIDKSNLQPIRQGRNLVSKVLDTYEELEDLRKVLYYLANGESTETAIAKIKELENEINGNPAITGSTKEAIVKVRVGQGFFRDRLLRRYTRCCLCGVTNQNLLTASHIKRWADSNPEEKVDIDNGFLLCANHDQLFDKGLISFSDDGTILISKELSDEDKNLLNVHENQHIRLTEKNKLYLAHHRKKTFKR